MTRPATFFLFFLALAAPVLAQVGELPPPAAGPTASSLDQAATWLLDAKRNFTAVKDYTCTLIKRETVKGKLGEENVIQMKVRNEPFSVYMRWVSPSQFAGQEVCYNTAKSKDQMRVHAKGILGIAGFISLDVDDPRAQEHSRHSIREAGIGNLIERTIKQWQTEKTIGQTQVRTADFSFNNRRCVRLEASRASYRQEYYASRSIFYLEKDSKIPIRNESYDWPRPGGAPEGELLETFSYVDLQFNTKLTDKDFDK